MEVLRTAQLPEPSLQVAPPQLEQVVVRILAVPRLAVVGTLLLGVVLDIVVVGTLLLGVADTLLLVPADRLLVEDKLPRLEAVDMVVVFLD